MQVFNALCTIEGDNTEKSIFLAGTIDRGNSYNWQEKVIRFLADKPYNIYNPRRDDWDDSWESNIDNNQFNEQVNWELNALEHSDLIIMNFLPYSQSPVTLIEFGLFAKIEKLIVCCPNEFWRSGNIHIVCEKYKIPLYKKLDELLLNIKL